MRLRLPPFVAACSMALLLGACASSHGLKPDGHLTDVDTLHAARSLAGAPLSDAAWPRRDWWTTLGDAQLDVLVEEALRDNPDLAMARARARQAEARAGLARSEQLPAINASGSVSGAHLPGTLIPDPLGGHFGWVKYAYANFKWDLDLWGGKRAAWEAAVDQAHAAAVDAHAARLAVSTSVARAYARLGYAFRQQSIAGDELERATHAHQLTAQRVAAGIDSQFQLKRGDAEVAQARRRLAAARHEVDAARIALAVLLGKGPDRGLDIARPEPLQPAGMALPPALPADLLGRRPDLVAARWRVEAAGRHIASAKAAFLPDISLGAMAGFAAGGSEALFQLPARFFQVAPAVSLPIFNGGKLRANLAGRDADYDLAVASYNKTLIGALNQVADDVKALASLKVQSEAQQQALEAARQAWKLSEQRYKAGVGSYLEALDVRQQLLEAEQAVAALHARQVDQSIQLIQALGGGYRADDGAPGVASADTAAAAQDTPSHPSSTSIDETTHD